MEMGGRNGKWLGTGRWTVGVGRVNDVYEFVTRVGGKCVRDGDVTVRRGDVDRKQGVIERELAANFFFLNVEEASDVFNHLFVGKGHLRVGWAVRRRRGNDVGCVTSVVNGGGRARWDEDGGRRARHCRAIKQVVKGVK